MSEDEHRNEVYSIDSNDDFTIFGGNSELLNVMFNGEINSFGEIMEDSIIYCKFYEKGKFYMIGMDGKIVTGLIYKKTEINQSNSEILKMKKIYFPEKYVEIRNNDEDLLPYSIYIREMADLEIDITSTACKEDILAVGCQDGSVHILSEQINEIFTVQGTNQEILQVEICNQYVLACTETELMIFQGHYMIFRIEKDEIQGFSVNDKSIYLITRSSVILYWFHPNIEQNQVEINQKEFVSFIPNFKRNDFEYNSNLVQKKYDFQISGVEKLLILGDTTIFAGDSFKMLSKNGEFSTDIKEINQLIHFENVIVFTGLDRTICIGDYRGTDFSKIQTQVGIVYDLIIRGNHVFLAGENGVEVFEIQCVESNMGLSYSLISKF